jgi:DNA-directed RNA polymerase subunit RPC12/RpoP
LQRNYNEKVKFFDIARSPKRQAWWTLPIVWSISYFFLKFYRIKIRKINTEGLKPPYILLCNHLQFLDFMVSSIANYPHRINNIVSIDGFNINPFLLRSIGSVPKRKFTNGLYIVKNINYILTELHDIVGLYPEARYSFVGTTSALPESLGKLIKYSKCPVVLLKFQGHHLQKPTWAKKSRKVKLQSEMKQILTVSEIEKYSFNEINSILHKEFDYNEYDYQKKNNILITEKYRAEGLHKVLYKCPDCSKEFEMDSKGADIFCNSCKSSWFLKETGELECKTGETKFPTIPKWYEWQRDEVRKEIENRSYRFSFSSHVYSLPHPEKFIDLGTASFLQDMSGIKVTGFYNGEPVYYERKALDSYSLHVEYKFPYLKGKDIVSVSSNEDSLFFVPEETNKIQKLSLATEELYKYHKEKLAQIQIPSPQEEGIR